MSPLLWSVVWGVGGYTVYYMKYAVIARLPYYSEFKKILKVIVISL